MIIDSFLILITMIVYHIDAGYKTCGGRPGSLGYEKKDAETYASWGIDFLKYDNCYSDGSKPEVRYPIMRDALNQTGRPIFYSLCGRFLPINEMWIIFLMEIEWGVDTPALWASDVGNCWRTADDIRDTWDAMIATMDIVNTFYFLVLSFHLFRSRICNQFRTMNLLTKQDLVVGTIQIVCLYLKYRR